MGGTPYLSESQVLMRKQIFMLRSMADRAFIQHSFNKRFQANVMDRHPLDITTARSALI